MRVHHRGADIAVPEQLLHVVNECRALWAVTWMEDRAYQLPGVWLPDALSRKFPRARSKSMSLTRKRGHPIKRSAAPYRRRAIVEQLSSIATSSRTTSSLDKTTGIRIGLLGRPMLCSQVRSMSRTCRYKKSKAASACLWVALRSDRLRDTQEGLNLGAPSGLMPQLVKVNAETQNVCFARYGDCNGNTGSARKPDRANELAAAACAEFPSVLYIAAVIVSNSLLKSEVARQ